MSAERVGAEDARARCGNRCKPTVLRRVRQAWAEGRGTFLRRALRRVAELPGCRRWMRVSVVELFHVTVNEHKRFRRIPKAYTVRSAGLDDLDALGPLFPDIERVRRRLDCGDICLVAFRKDEACAGVWLTVGPGTYGEDLQDSGCVYHVPSGAAWTYDGRGRRLGAWGCLMAHLPGPLAELGVEELFTSIDLGNHLSIDSHLSLGYRPIGQVSHVSVLSLARCRFRPSEGRWQSLPGTVAGLEIDAAKSI